MLCCLNKDAVRAIQAFSARSTHRDVNVTFANEMEIKMMAVCILQRAASR